MADRARRLSSRVTDVAAVTAGRLARVTPGLLGAGLLVYGLGQIYWPLAPITCGIALLIVDRRIP